MMLMHRETYSNFEGSCSRAAVCHDDGDRGCKKESMQKREGASILVIT